MTLARKRTRLQITNPEPMDGIEIFPSSYGSVTVRQWLELEAERLGAARANPVLWIEDGRGWIDVDAPDDYEWEEPRRTAKM